MIFDSLYEFYFSLFVLEIDPLLDILWYFNWLMDVNVLFCECCSAVYLTSIRDGSKRDANEVPFIRQARS